MAGKSGKGNPQKYSLKKIPGALKKVTEQRGHAKGKVSREK